MCVNAASYDYPCAFYSTEMMSSQLTARLLAAKTGISSRTIIQSPLSAEQMKKYDEAIYEVGGLPIFFDDTSTLNVEKISSSIRSLVRKKSVKVAFVDYLQVLQTNEKMNRTEEQFFGVVARKFKNLAKELQITIVLLSQIARSKDTTEPTLSRIRGSGQITEAADVVLLIYRPEEYGKAYTDHRINVDPSGTAQIKLAKGRNIGTGDFICGFDASTTHFYELTTIPTIGEAKRDPDRPF
jgi:replicative DNA helicase